MIEIQVLKDDNRALNEQLSMVSEDLIINYENSQILKDEIMNLRMNVDEVKEINKKLDELCVEHTTKIQYLEKEATAQSQLKQKLNVRIL